MSKNYQINEKDIDNVISFLKITDSENATPEMAIEILEHLKASFHAMSHEDPKALEKVYQDLKRQKKLSRN